MSDAYTDVYAILGISRSASADEIRQAYFSQVRLHPPEREPDEFKRIRAAYDQLRTPEKRIDTDMKLLEDWPAPVRPVVVPQVDLSIHEQSVLDLLKACTDLAQRNSHNDFREVRL
ncbi:MAG: DnaJ domain-containing protein [Chloroflexi bacterium]|nr:DnaJ domain-containing protein [Chloroflexota bacterium]